MYTYIYIYIYKLLQDGYRQGYNVNSARCDTVWKCFLVVVDMGLRKGDVGSAMDDIQWRDLSPGMYVCMYVCMHMYEYVWQCHG